jgi:hypothetical protein
MSNYISKLYFKSNRNIKSLFSEFLTEENGATFLDLQKIYPCPDKLNKTKKKADGEKNKDLLDIYKDNVSLYGYMDGESWKIANWGELSDKFQCSFINEDRILSFKSNFIPIQALSKAALKLGIKDDMCIDFVGKKENTQGRYVFFSKNPEENFINKTEK